MKYLLSSGKTTENPITYIKDVILVNMLLLPNEIPYFSGGSEELITDIIEDNLQFHITEIVKPILTRIRSMFPNTSIELNNVEINSDRVNVSIKINDVVEIYEIKRFN